MSNGYQGGNGRPPQSPAAPPSRDAVPRAGGPPVAGGRSGVPADALDRAQGKETPARQTQSDPRVRLSSTATLKTGIPRVMNHNIGAAAHPGMARDMMPATAPVAEAPTPKVSLKAGDGFVRLELPSKLIPYSFHAEGFHIRPLRGLDILGIVAAEENGNFSALLDVLNGCVSQDIRELTTGDFRFIMYWLRLNSYPATPYSVNWVSRYGNPNSVQVARTDLQIIELAMTKAEYDAFRAKGLCFPTVRDAERLRDISLSAADRFKLERAQFIYVPPDAYASASNLIEISEAIAAYRDKVIDEGSMSLFEAIREFSTKIEHGVKEKIEVTDAKFNATAAVGYLRSAAAEISVLIEADTYLSNPVLELEMTDRASEMMEEADEIEKKIAEGKTSEVVARKETIVLAISAMDFFSTI